MDGHGYRTYHLATTPLGAAHVDKVIVPPILANCMRVAAVTGCHGKFVNASQEGCECITVVFQEARSNRQAADLRVMDPPRWGYLWLQKAAPGMFQK